MTMLFETRLVTTLAIILLAGCAPRADSGSGSGVGSGGQAGSVSGASSGEVTPAASEPGASSAATSASGATSGPPVTKPPTVVRPFDGVTVFLGASTRVELEARVSLDAGWLEQIACGMGTREHEALVVPRATASQIHAALLLAGAEPGMPGRWTYDEANGFKLVPPRGTQVRISFRWTDADGVTHHDQVHEWVRNHATGEALPDRAFVFGGSRIDAVEGLGEVYAADHSGSIIGLVTFGDEVLGYRDVISDAAELQPQEWEVNTDRVPPWKTEVTVVIEPLPSGEVP